MERKNKMGFTKTFNPETGRYKLSCDFCGSIEGTKKTRCPYGYCQAWAVCANCRKEKKHLKRNSCGQEGGHEYCKSQMDDKKKAVQQVLLGGNTFSVRQWGVNGNDDGKPEMEFCVLLENNQFRLSCAISEITKHSWQTIPMLENIASYGNKIIFEDGTYKDKVIEPFGMFSE